MVAHVVISTSKKFSENRSGGNKLSNVRSFITLRSEEGLTSPNKDNSAN